MTHAAGALVVRDLRCRFDDPPAQALDGVSIDAAKGELVAIMGPSGSGHLHSSDYRDRYC